MEEELTAALLGERLKRARISAGLSQEMAASRSNLARPCISLLEQGKRNLSTLELVRLADSYSVSLTTLVGREETTEDPFVALGRMAHGVVVDDSRFKPVILKYLDIFREATRLEQLTECSARLKRQVHAYSLSTPASDEEAVEQGKQMAELERKRLDLGTSPVQDIAELISSQGIWTVAAELPNEMAGLFISHSECGMAVLVNQEHKVARRRFSYAHEYAHALVDSELGSRVTTPHYSSELREKRANAFASEFLLPDSGIKDFLERRGKKPSLAAAIEIWDASTGEHSSLQMRGQVNRVGVYDVAVLANEYKLSYQTAAYRVKDSGLIKKSEADDLVLRSSEGAALMQALDMFDPGADADGQEQYLTRHVAFVAMEALEQDVISSGKFWDICMKVQLKPDKIEKLLSIAIQKR